MHASKRLRAALALAVASAAAVAAVASAGTTPGSPDEPTALATDPTYVSEMTTLETYMQDNLQQGKAVPIVFRTAARTPGDVVLAGGWGDSGLWTGVYLGGEAMRYATAKHYLEDSAELSADQLSFWTTQRDQALEHIHAILVGEHRDINIAEDWTGQLKVPPTVNIQDPTGSHAADFGGGIIHGERGMIMRACTEVGLYPLGVNPPDIHPDNPTENNSNHVFRITWTHGDGRTYDCETSPSRDTYAGVVFGLLTTFDLVSKDFPEMRSQIRTDLLSMGNFLVKYGWNYPRPHGYVSAKHDFDGFFSPLFVYVPMARLNMANAVRHVADEGGTPADQQKWDRIWSEEFATEGPQLGPSMIVDSAQPNDGYYKFNLHHLAGFDLLRTTTGSERDQLARGFAVMDATTRDDIDAHFEAITYSATGEKSRLDDAVTHLEQWLTYRANVENGQVVKNSADCEVKFHCVPQDQYELAVNQAPGGSVTWYPGQPAVPPVSNGNGMRAARPLPVAVRPPTDFLWQRPPTALDGQQPYGAQWREAGVDYLTPYWMLRYFTEVEHPKLRPFDETGDPVFL